MPGFNPRSRFARKKKKKTEEKEFVVYNCHSLPSPVASKKGWIQIASVDPGRFHFGMRCERWHSDNTIETIDFSLTDFSIPDKGEVILEEGKENFLYNKCTRVLKAYCEDFLKDCHFICVEKQLDFVPKNTKIFNY